MDENYILFFDGIFVSLSVCYSGKFLITVVSGWRKHFANVYNNLENSGQWA